MESVTIKVHNQMAKEIEEIANGDYGTKTEFIREAIRDKLKDIRKEQIINELRKYFGKAKKKTPNREDRRIREEISKKIAKRFGLKLN